jgi:hypothetical protein
VVVVAGGWLDCCHGGCGADVVGDGGDDVQRYDGGDGGGIRLGRHRSGGDGGVVVSGNESDAGDAGDGSTLYSDRCPVSH